MKKLLLIWVCCVGTVLGADSGYYGDYLQSISRNDPGDSEMANTIGAWLRQTRAGLLDAFGREHSLSGQHKSITFSSISSIYTNAGTYILTSTNIGMVHLAQGTNVMGFVFPTPASVGAGKFFGIKRIDGNTNAIGVAAVGGFVEGAASIILTNAWQSGLYVSDGMSNYYGLIQQPVQPPQYVNPTKVWVSFDGRQRPIQTLSQLGGVATATFADPISVFAGQKLQVRGANYSGYNGFFTVLTAGANSFTYTVDPATPSPASGAIADCFIIASSGVNYVARNTGVASGAYDIIFTSALADTKYLATINIALTPVTPVLNYAWSYNVTKLTDHLYISLYSVKHYNNGDGAFSQDGNYRDAEQIDVMITKP